MFWVTESSHYHHFNLGNTFLCWKIHQVKGVLFTDFPVAFWFGLVLPFPWALSMILFPRDHGSQHVALEWVLTNRMWAEVICRSLLGLPHRPSSRLCSCLFVCFVFWPLSGSLRQRHNMEGLGLWIRASSPSARRADATSMMSLKYMTQSWNQYCSWWYHSCPNLSLFGFLLSQVFSVPGRPLQCTSQN